MSWFRRKLLRRLAFSSRGARSAKSPDRPAPDEALTVCPRHPAGERGRACALLKGSSAEAALTLTRATHQALSMTYLKALCKMKGAEIYG
jgi:hypothetical protein